VPSGETLAAAPSRRDQHKSRTRQALRDAALELFSTQGYDATTTEEISEQAGVAARTFFRYFPTKESVLHAGKKDWMQALADDYVAIPLTVPDIDAVCAALVRAVPTLAERRKRLLMYRKAVDSSPTLRGQQHDHNAEDVATIAAAVAARRELRRPDEHCTLVATVALFANQWALDRWLAGPANGDLAAMIAEEFELLSAAFAED
jgi:AcrR family transcriptional regulator